MNPWLTIWTKPQETIDQIKDSEWVNGRGLIPYFLFGINSAVESRFTQALYFDSGFAGFAEIIAFIMLVFSLGVLGAVFIRLVWVNLILFFGKIWKGQASKRNIDTVLSLCLIPEFFRSLYLIVASILKGGLSDLEISGAFTIVCWLIGFRILLIGLSRVQKFSYGFALLNI